jgi:hypothetical protein
MNDEATMKYLVIDGAMVPVAAKSGIRHAPNFYDFKLQDLSFIVDVFMSSTGSSTPPSAQTSLGSSRQACICAPSDLQQGWL